MNVTYSLALLLAKHANINEQGYQINLLSLNRINMFK